MGARGLVRIIEYRKFDSISPVDESGVTDQYLPAPIDSLLEFEKLRQLAKAPVGVALTGFAQGSADRSRLRRASSSPRYLG